MLASLICCVFGQFLDRAARFLPGGKATCQVLHRLEAHLLQGLRRQQRAPARRAMNDEGLVLGEDRLVIRAFADRPRIRACRAAHEMIPECGLRVRARGCRGYRRSPHRRCSREVTGFGGRNALDLGLGLRHQLLVAMNDLLRHAPSLVKRRLQSRHGARRSSVKKVREATRARIRSGRCG